MKTKMNEFENFISSLTCSNLASSEMTHSWSEHFSHPPLFNDLGCFRTGTNPMDIYNFMFPPFSGNGEGTAILFINRKHAALSEAKVGYTWYPDKVRRRAIFEGFKVETITRAFPDEPGAMIKLTISNPSPKRRSAEIAIKVAGRLKNTIEGWASIGPQIKITDEHKERWCYDQKIGAMAFTSTENAYSYQGSFPAPDTVEGKTFLYNINLPSNGRWCVNFVAALGETENKARDRFLRHISGFDDYEKISEKRWEDKIRKAFIPMNDIYSGHLPAFITTNEDLLRLYLMTTLGCLCLRRNNPLSSYGTAFVTLSPNYWTTASFLWDMMIAAPFYALLDPEVMRKHIEVWLASDIKNYLATDYVTGKPLGYWYAVNSSAVVRLAYNYLKYSGNFTWLDKSINGRSVIDRLEEHALMWHEYDKNGHGLADCGGVDNLFECVSTYTHEAAGFNAMWVAALRQVAMMRNLRNEKAKAMALKSDAKILLKNIFKLYIKGKGFWRCGQPDGTYNEVCHIYDFVAILESISSDLPDYIKKEMYESFEKNHRSDNWTRSLSSWDDDAHRSMRVDLQWTGSYASIPAQCINGLYKIGYSKEAYKWLSKIAPVAKQGPIGQAHWSPPLFPSFEGGAWKTSYAFPYMCDWTVAANGAYPAMFIESIFGADATLDSGLKWRGSNDYYDKNSSLRNLAYHGKNYRVDKSGIHPEEQD